MWQAEADTELTLSATLATTVGQICFNHGEILLEYGMSVRTIKNEKE